jgi:hypothetical protein
VLLDKLAVVAPRAARVDSLPYRLGDQAPVGAPLAILLAGDAPYARIYIPVQQRIDVRVGDTIEVRVAGREKAYAGKVRMIRSEPTFTPYYALIGDDAARLSYLAEVALGTLLGLMYWALRARFFKSELPWCWTAIGAPLVFFIGLKPLMNAARSAGDMARFGQLHGAATLLFLIACVSVGVLVWRGGAMRPAK